MLKSANDCISFISKKQRRIREKIQKGKVKMGRKVKGKVRKEKVK